jgi:hypothetical protein
MSAPTRISASVASRPAADVVEAVEGRSGAGPPEGSTALAPWTQPRYPALIGGSSIPPTKPITCDLLMPPATMPAR